jgi:ketosteroid isomerase-like protein
VRVVGSPEPAVVPARAGLEAQPLPKLPIANQLIWEPYTGQVSSDGSLGWLTGGYVQLNQAQREVVAQGAYFSVWKRQANGTWRVWLDEGVNLPQVWQGAAPFRVAPDPDTGEAGTASETVAQAEAAVSVGRDAWAARLGKDVRWHINASMPIVGRDAVTSAPPIEMRYRVLRSEVAGSGDLAVTIGSFERVRGGGPTRGTWVRVWKRDLSAHWRIVFQTEK